MMAIVFVIPEYVNEWLLQSRGLFDRPQNSPCADIDIACEHNHIGIGLGKIERRVLAAKKLQMEIGINT